MEAGRKNILVLVPGYSRNEGDWSIPVLRHLVRHLDQHHDVTVLAVRYPFTSSEYEIEDIKVIAVGAGEHTGVRQIPDWIKTARLFRREHKKRKFDLIHAFWGYEPGILATVLGSLYSVPVVVSMMGGELIYLEDIDYGMQHSRLARWSLKRVFGSADVLTAGSSPMMQLCRQFDESADVRMIPLGVDADYFNSTDSEAGTGVPEGGPPDAESRSGRKKPADTEFRNDQKRNQESSSFKSRDKEGNNTGSRPSGKHASDAGFQGNTKKGEETPGAKSRKKQDEPSSAGSRKSGETRSSKSRERGEAVSSGALRSGGGGFDLLHVGSHAAVKDHSTLLEAFRKAAGERNDLTLHLVGSLPVEIRNRIQTDDQFSKRVICHGEVEHHHLPEFYRKADLFVLSSRFESQAMVIVEALMCGCPALSTRVGAAKDLLPPSFRIPVNDSDALGKGILAALDDYADTREKILNYARPRLGPYRIEHTVREFGGIYFTI